MTKYLLFAVNDTVKPLNFYLDNIKAIFNGLGLQSKCLSCTSEGVWMSAELNLNFFTRVYQNKANVTIKQGVDLLLTTNMELRMHPNISILTIQDEYPTTVDKV